MLKSNENLCNLIVDLLNTNKIKMPTQPEIAVRIRECAEDPHLTSAKLAKVISQDPGLTAKFINIANSPLMRGAINIDSLPEAISRLGMVFVTNTSTGLAMEQLFQATDESIDQILYSVWQISTKAAAYSHVLAKHFSKIPPDKAALAGLMSHIGILPILVYAQDFNELSDKQQLEKIIGDNHHLLGQYILNSWKFPEDIAQVPQQIKQMETLEKIDLSSIVFVALLHAGQKEKIFFNVQDSAVDAVHKTFPNIDEVMQNEIFQSELDASLKFYSDK